MKKMLFVSIVALICVASLHAQKGDFSIGGQFNYASKNTMVGLGANIQYEFINDFRVSPEFIYYLENDDLSAFNCNLNFHYLIHPGGNFILYPMVGFSFARFHDDYWDDEIDDYSGETRFGANIGFGAEYRLNEHIRFYTEERFQILKDWNQGVTSLGIRYKF